VDEIEEYFLKEAAVPREAPLLVTLADDGEKFGSWPGTYEYIWQNGYMDRFLSMLERHLDVIEVVPMADYIENINRSPRVYTHSHILRNDGMGIANGTPASVYTGKICA